MSAPRGALPSPAVRAEGPALDPVAFLKGLASLRRVTGMYPAGHPAIMQRLRELEETVQAHLRTAPSVCVDVIHGAAHLDGIPFRQESATGGQVVRELTDLGIDSIHVHAGVTVAELQALSELLWQLKEARGGAPLEAQLAGRGIRHVSLGRLVPLDTRWRATEWPDAPGGPLDPDYEASLDLTQRTFEDVTAGRGADLATVRQIVQLLVRKVTGSSVALAQILAVKLYENLTYVHSVNVATLSLLLAGELGFDERATSAVAEAALLHDLGKTRIPLDVLRKPGALDRRERALMEAHTTYGAELLVEMDGLQPLTPTVALEHHRSVTGGGYPDLGDGVVPHPLSQLVSVADIYEAMTGARSYQDPAMPEQACLVLARLAGPKLNTAVVKAFVNAITFFPVGSLVRTSRDEVGVVIRTTPGDPLHPVIARASANYDRSLGALDTSVRDGSGAYERHVIETLRPPEGGLDVARFLEPIA
jgi:putative nucleotidyltransferase with HDIG domain